MKFVLKLEHIWLDLTLGFVNRRGRNFSITGANLRDSGFGDFFDAVVDRDKRTGGYFLKGNCYVIHGDCQGYDNRMIKDIISIKQISAPHGEWVGLEKD